MRPPDIALQISSATSSVLRVLGVELSDRLGRGWSPGSERLA